MWKRKLSSALLLLLFCLRALEAQSSGSKWQGLDDQVLLREAASMIEKLKSLNEALKKEASEALRESRELSARLEALKNEKEALLKDMETLRKALEVLKIVSVESERMRLELVMALRISEASWRSYAREAERRIRRQMLVGIGIGFSLGLGVALGALVVTGL